MIQIWQRLGVGGLEVSGEGGDIPFGNRMRASRSVPPRVGPGLSLSDLACCRDHYPSIKYDGPMRRKKNSCQAREALIQLRGAAQPRLLP
jgi:hypothetical protein